MGESSQVQQRLRKGNWHSPIQYNEQCQEVHTNDPPCLCASTLIPLNVLPNDVSGLRRGSNSPCPLIGALHKGGLHERRCSQGSKCHESCLIKALLLVIMTKSFQLWAQVITFILVVWYCLHFSTAWANSNHGRSRLWPRFRLILGHFQLPPSCDILVVQLAILPVNRFDRLNVLHLILQNGIEELLHALYRLFVLWDLLYKNSVVTKGSQLHLRSLPQSHHPPEQGIQEAIDKQRQYPNHGRQNMQSPASTGHVRNGASAQKFLHWLLVRILLQAMACSVGWDNNRQYNDASGTEKRHQVVQQGNVTCSVCANSLSNILDG
mmetsp:Transcript_53810/g.128193  ORF Transcript_53810/g.128193 Transcript_53810/m.128193 type:complete len:322 (-) Transcript_53810:295-1260(-)